MINTVLYHLIIITLFYGVYASGSLNIVNDNRLSWKSVWTSVSGQYSYAVATDGYIYKSTDYSTTWTIALENQQNWNYITADEGMILVIASIYGGGFYYTFSGSSWEEFPAFGNLDWYGHCVTPNEGVILYAVERTNGFIYSSEYSDGDFVANNNSQKWNGISCSNTAVDSQYYYLHAIAYKGFIYSSYDNAVTWVASFSENLPWSAIAVSLDSQYVYATTYGQYIYCSNNYGNIGTWQLSYAHNTLWTSITARSGTEAYAVDLLGGIYALESGNWSKVYNSYKKLVSVSASNDTSYILTSGFQDYIYLYYPSTAPTPSPTALTPAPSIYPTLFPTSSPTDLVTGLIVNIDFTDPDCYTSGNTNYTNLIDGNTYSLYGTTYQNTDGSLRVDNTQSGSDTAASGVYIGTYNVYTISMWIKIESIDNTQSKYLFDMRTDAEAYCYVAGSTGLTSYSINGASYYSSANTFCKEGFNSNIYLFSRYLETEGIDCSVKSIYLFSEFISEETNYQNYLDTKNYFTTAPTLSPTTLSSYQYSTIIGSSDIGTNGYSGNAKCNSGYYINKFRGHYNIQQNIPIQSIGFDCTDGGIFSNSLYDPDPYSTYYFYSCQSGGFSGVTVYYSDSYIFGIEIFSNCGNLPFGKLSASNTATHNCDEGKYIVGINWYTNVYLIGIQFVCGVINT